MFSLRNSAISPWNFSKKLAVSPWNFKILCKVLKVKPVYQQMTLSPKLGVVGISTLWHFRLPLLIQMFIKVASSPRLSGIGMPSPILWSHPLKMQRIVLLSSLLWWELGTNSLITGPGEWLSFRRFTSNYPDPDPWNKKYGDFSSPALYIKQIKFLSTTHLSEILSKI